MKSVETAAGTIEYDEVGEGPPVVLLHGVLMDHTVWDEVLPLLPTGFSYIRPLLPLGSHRTPLKPDADRSLEGQVGIVADVLDALDLHDVTLVHSDWGGGLFLTSLGRDDRVARMVVLPCEAWENFPPGLPGKMLTLVSRIPGGLQIGLRQLRVGWLRRLPFLYGAMARRPVADELIRRWTEPALTISAVRHDVLAYFHSDFDDATLVRHTEALRDFAGEALVLWSPDNTVMLPEHGRRLAALMPRAELVEVRDAYVLSMLDAPAEVATHIGAFLTRHATRPA